MLPCFLGTNSGRKLGCTVVMVAIRDLERKQILLYKNACPQAKSLLWPCKMAAASTKRSVADIYRLV